MKRNGLKGWVRGLVITAGLTLFAVLVLPIWRIELQAPQYPEGLVLKIYAGKLGGNVDIINGLNHYIGMQTLHAENFIEFTLLPYLIGAFAILFVIVGIGNRKKPLFLLLCAFLLFGVVSMVDFYRWNYNYGHNLDPNAAIKVPGMAYQPPLLGYKQLLNFAAYSVPDAGGFIFIGAGVVLCIAAVAEWRSAKARRGTAPANTARKVTTVMLLVAGVSLGSCNTAPEPLKLGVDNCYFCKMTISDARFGAEVITKKGKYYKFDDTHCLLGFLQSYEVKKTDIAGLYLADFAGNHALINADNTMLLKSEELRSPMGGNIAAFTNADSLKEMIKTFNGTETSWKDLYKP